MSQYAEREDYINDIVDKLDDLPEVGDEQIPVGFLNEHIRKKAWLWIAYRPCWLAIESEQRWKTDDPTTVNQGHWTGCLAKNDEEDEPILASEFDSRRKYDVQGLMDASVLRPRRCGDLFKASL